MAIRKLDISDFPKIDIKLGPEPELGFVPIDKLIIDDSYQRHIEKRGLKNILKIAANFDWAKFSPLMVSKRPDGLFAIIDGQHRSHAAALIGATRVPALISDLTAGEQAAAFSWINGTVTALNPNQIFKAALAALEPWAVQCDAIVARADCRLMTSPGSAASKKPGQVYTVNLVRKHVDAGNAQYLVAVLGGIRKSSVRDQVYYYNGYGLNALVPPAIENGITRPDIITKFLDEHDLEDTHNRVLQLMKQPEFRNQTFKALFGKSVATLMKAHAQQIAKAEDVKL